MAHARTPAAASSTLIDLASDTAAAFVAEYAAKPFMGHTPDSDDMITNQGRLPSVAAARMCGIASRASAKGARRLTLVMRSVSFSRLSPAGPGEPVPALATATSTRP